jgi:hypothetical protein
MKKSKLFAGLALVIAVSACTKVKDVEINPTVVKPASFKEIKVSDNFLWKTTASISIHVQGFNSIVPVTKTFIVSSEDQKEVYYAANALMSESFKAQFSLPTYVKKVKVNYGTISKLIDVNANSINFDYLMPAPAEEIQ